MGSSRSPVVANLYIGHLEETALETARLTPRLASDMWTTFSLFGRIDSMS